MSISDVISRARYLDNLESIMKENPDLFNALANDKFD